MAYAGQLTVEGNQEYNALSTSDLKTSNAI